MYFKYCPKCKAKLSKTQARGRVLGCKKCGFVFYFAPASGADIVLANEQGEILLAKRAFAPKKGYWDLPGGFIEFGESAEDAITREIKEELGINLSGFSYLGSYPDRYYYKGINYHTLAFEFYGTIKTQQLHPADDVSEIKFFTWDNLPTDKFCSPRMVQVLKDYKKIGSKNK